MAAHNLGNPDQPLALNGVRVVDFTQVIAGPYCGQQLALLGAEVTKVEAPTGDPLRWRGGSSQDLADEGLSTPYQAHAFGKPVTYLDWNTRAGCEHLLELVDGADVFLTNLRAHVLPSLGLDAATLLARNPRLIVCTIAGYGKGPSETWPAYDHTVQAASGLMMLTGSDAGGTRAGAPILDYATGMAALAGILAALMLRTQNSRGQHVRVDLLSVAHQLLTAQRTDMALTGNEPKRRGNDASSGEPLSSVFDTQAGRLALAVNEPHQFHKLARAVGRAEWIGDPRYATRRARRENRTALRAELSALLSGHTASHWEERLNGAGVAAAVVRSLPQSLQHSGASAEPSLFQLQSGTLRPCELTAPTSPTPSMIAAHLST